MHKLKYYMEMRKAHLFPCGSGFTNTTTPTHFVTLILLSLSHTTQYKQNIYFFITFQYRLGC